MEELLREQAAAEGTAGEDGAGTIQEETEAPEDASDPAENDEKSEAPDSAEEAEQSDTEEEDPGETTEDDPESGEDSGSEENGGGEKKGFFKRNKKGDKEKNSLKEKVAGLEDRVMRQMAEFENYRRRTEKEKQQMFSMGERNVIEKMLPIVDNFERGLAAVPEEEKSGAVASGMEMVYRQLVKQLEDLGVTPIEAVGKEFDPNLHNAVMQVESEEYPSGTVAQELQKGYKYRDTVIRYSMVAVVQ